MTQINREHKDRLFRLIFADEKNKANTLSLYNALNGSSYENALLLKNSGYPMLFRFLITVGNSNGLPR